MTVWSLVLVEDVILRDVMMQVEVHKVLEAINNGWLRGLNKDRVGVDRDQKLATWTKKMHLPEIDNIIGKVQEVWLEDITVMEW